MQYHFVLLISYINLAKIFRCARLVGKKYDNFIFYNQHFLSDYNFCLRTSAFLILYNLVKPQHVPNNYVLCPL